MVTIHCHSMPAVDGCCTVAFIRPLLKTLLWDVTITSFIYSFDKIKDLSNLVKPLLFQKFFPPLNSNLSLPIVLFILQVLMKIKLHKYVELCGENKNVMVWHSMKT